MRYRITLKTVPYIPASAPESKTVKVIIEQDLENATQACREVDMYNNAPFFGQRLVVDMVHMLRQYTIDNDTGSEEKHWVEVYKDE